MIGGAVLCLAIVSALSGLYTITQMVGKRRLPYASEVAIWIVMPVALTIIVCGLLISIPVAVNNFHLDRFKNNLYTYPLPPQTQVTDRHATVELTGNSNHCDFWAEQTMAAYLSRQEIETYYADVVFPPVYSTPQGEHDAWATGVHLPLQPRLTFHETLSNGQLSFTLTLFDFGYPAGFDFRCH